jgi:hypothetical protein
MPATALIAGTFTGLLALVGLSIGFTFDGTCFLLEAVLEELVTFFFE